MLTNNQLSTLKDLEPISALATLTNLSLVDNPVRRRTTPRFRLARRRGHPPPLLHPRPFPLPIPQTHPLNPPALVRFAVGQAPMAPPLPLLPRCRLCADLLPPRPPAPAFPLPR